MERGFSKWFVKYCLHMNAIVMAYPEITEDEDLAASPFSAEKGSDETFKKILRLPFKHATCYAFNYTETLSSV
ncbi:hypothetical protein NC651_000182 [Populus alba x Populus x berolinensis]|nr:hypothetical protein NC651_000182 [Populus alba x Populus x berolinensis]